MKTLAAPARIEVEIKRSRFITNAARVDTLADTLDFYESVADPSATHNCWAWKLDHKYRFNDDGEPASTAGKPIHAAIEGKGLDNMMVVVTRYYGGIKLGVPPPKKTVSTCLFGKSSAKLRISFAKLDRQRSWSIVCLTWLLKSQYGHFAAQNGQWM